MIKKHAKWIGLGVVAVPVLWLAIPTSWTAPSQSEPTVTPIYEQPLKVTGSQLMKPDKVNVSAIELDSSALEVIRKSQLIGSAKLDTELALEQAKAREASKRGLESEGVKVPDMTVITGGYQPPSTIQTPVLSEDILSRLNLNALITAPNGKTFAYLSLDNGRPINVSEGGYYQGVLIRKITPTKVVIAKGKDSRVLRGQE